MRKFECQEYGKTIILHLSRGDLVLETIVEELAKSGVKNAIMTGGIGSLRKVSIHAINALSDIPSDTYFKDEKPVELSSMQGLVLDGEPHIHVTATAPDGSVYVGHLEPGCEVQYLLEMSFIEVKDMNLARRPDSTGLGYGVIVRKED